MTQMLSARQKIACDEFMEQWTKIRLFHDSHPETRSLFDAMMYLNTDFIDASLLFQDGRFKPYYTFVNMALPPAIVKAMLACQKKEGRQARATNLFLDFDTSHGYRRRVFVLDVATEVCDIIQRLGKNLGVTPPNDYIYQTRLFINSMKKAIRKKWHDIVVADKVQPNIVESKINVNVLEDTIKHFARKAENIYLSGNLFFNHIMTTYWSGNPSVSGNLEISIPGCFEPIIDSENEYQLKKMFRIGVKQALAFQVAYARYAKLSRNLENIERARSLGEYLHAIRLKGVMKYS